MGKPFPPPSLLFLEREEGERETSMCGCVSHVPALGTWPATHVP